MAIITISRGSYSKGKEIAEKVAERLDYHVCSRDILLEASEHFNIPEIKLVRALHDAPSVLDRFTHGKERFVAFLQEAFLEHVQQNNVVYHGLAGHFFVADVAHALKVRIIADLEDRVRLEMEREKIDADEARHVILKDDFERRKWGMALYGHDTAEAWLYDLVIHIRKITVDNAVDLICNTVSLPQFRSTPESQKTLDDLVLAAQVKAELITKWPDVKVSADGGKVTVHVEAPVIKERVVCDQILPVVQAMPGVRDAKVHVIPAALLSAF